jgi:hypothetical protein
MIIQYKRNVRFQRIVDILTLRSESIRRHRILWWLTRDIANLLNFRYRCDICILVCVHTDIAWNIAYAVGWVKRLENCFVVCKRDYDNSALRDGFVFNRVHNNIILYTAIWLLAVSFFFLLFDPCLLHRISPSSKGLSGENCGFELFFIVFHSFGRF